MKNNRWFVAATGMVLCLSCGCLYRVMDNRYIEIQERCIREKGGVFAENVYSLNEAVEILSNSTCLTTEKIFEAGIASNYALALRTLWSAGNRRKDTAQALARSSATLYGKIYGMASLFDMNAMREYEDAKRNLFLEARGPVLFLNGCLRELLSVGDVIGMIERANFAETLIFKERYVDVVRIHAVSEDTQELAEWVDVAEIYDDQTALGVLAKSGYLSSGIRRKDGKVDRRAVAFTHLLLSCNVAEHAQRLLQSASTDSGKLYALILLHEADGSQYKEESILFDSVVVRYPETVVTLSGKEIADKIGNGWLCSELTMTQTFVNPRDLSDFGL